MKFTQEKALLHLTGKSTLDDLKMESIEKLVSEYPFFSPGQYLFSAKLKKEDHPLASAQAIKTALFFSNPNWLQFQLDSINETRIDEAPKLEMDTALLRSIHQKDKAWDEMINPSPIEESSNTPDEVFPEDPAEAQINHIEQEKEPLPTENYWQPAEISSAAPEQEHIPAPIPTSDITIPTIETVRRLMRGIDGNTEEQIPVSSPLETTPEKEVELAPITESVEFMPVFSAIASAELQPEQDFSEQPENNHELPDQAKSDAKIASILSAQLAEFKKPIEQETQLEIETQQEKLHTIDYFASQGIQIDLSKIPQDKLTTKLRKFTDWLKDMKNHHPNPTDLGTSPELEKKVAETALVSNESKEILTETMAEVLVKQGQIDKAIQLFIKLSFSNPEKSAYFAAKIQQLKGI
ncbi:MAG: hypothetical protein EAZ12_03095 [Sphingobacteriia bacterium]|nr:MAG: hypothetical protein EAZ12_03095 [Sphingobacteriia bacterium]